MKRFSEIRAEKVQLLHDLRERDQTIEELRSTISNRDSERGEMGQRVSRIVEQIEDWERSFDEEQGREIVEQVSDPVLPDFEGDKDDREDEGRVQHNLFSVANSER
jgi:uncharacterized coiled-coil DUF342 family protein